MQGRERVSYTLSEHDRSRKAFCRVFSVRFTAQVEANGPKYSPLIVWAPRCLRSCGAAWSWRSTISGKLLSSRSTRLKRGFSRLMRLLSSRRASASVRVVTNSMARVITTMCCRRWLWARPWAYWTTRFFSERALPT